MEGPGRATVATVTPGAVVGVAVIGVELGGVEALAATAGATARVVPNPTTIIAAPKRSGRDRLGLAGAPTRRTRLRRVWGGCCTGFLLALSP